LDEPWDFVNNPFDDTGNEDYWDIDDSINNGYPYFANPITKIDDEEIQISNYLIEMANYPNPFNPSTTIKYSLKEDSKVKLNIYNIKGQNIKQLVNDQLTAGQHSVIWTGKDDDDSPVSSGIYFYNLKTENHEKTKRMILLK